MPKLDTTIDNLERKSNKVTGTVPSASWTDTQYPSAKTLYNAYNNLTDRINLVHPIGSIITTSTKANPSADLGGTWELVDKGFKNTTTNLTSTYWAKPDDYALNSELLEGSFLSLADHNISLRLNVKSNIALSDTEAYIGKLLLPSCGVTGLVHAILYDVVISDGANGTLCYRFDTNGTLSIWEALNIADTHTAAAGSSFYIHIEQTMLHTYMLDDFCDKFYWKRTA